MPTSPPSDGTGVLEPLNDPAYFARVAVDAEAGTIVWPDGLDLAPSRCMSRPALIRSSPRSSAPRHRPLSTTKALIL
jgi:Protein of unknown function (DUF2442)